MLIISPNVTIPDREIEIGAVRAQGPGGQHGDKAATAIHLRFDINASAALPDDWKARLLTRSDHRITGNGVVVIKAQGYRSREANEQDARERLRALIRSAAETPRPRRPTRPSAGAKRRRIESKKQRGHTKALRKPPRE